MLRSSSEGGIIKIGPEALVTQDLAPGISSFALFRNLAKEKGLAQEGPSYILRFRGLRSIFWRCRSFSMRGGENWRDPEEES
jgi:hypothetical protein